MEAVVSKRQNGTSATDFREEAQILIRGRKWLIGSASLRKSGLRGLCMTSRVRSLPNLIIVSSSIPSRGPMHLRTLIHETLHAAMPDASENAVEEAADIVAVALASMGYERRVISKLEAA
jgi:hypothetical protein